MSSTTKLREMTKKELLNLLKPTNSEMYHFLSLISESCDLCTDFLLDPEDFVRVNIGTTIEE